MASISSLLSVSLYSLPKNSKSFKSIPQNKRHNVNYVSCKASNGEEDSLTKFDRRDVLFGLGGLYAATALSRNNFALAESSLSPDVLNCENARTPAGLMDCCPPKIKEIIDFTPPVVTTPRVRPAIQFMTPTQIADLEKGIQMMIALDKDENDPHSFKYQANVHCAYCDHAYKQLGFLPKTDFQVHFNALFFPFQPAYLYFFERILCDLLGKPDFALPFWNWDSPPCMYMPEVYTKIGSWLYDENRDKRHLSLKLLYLNYNGTENPPFNVLDCNLRWMNKQMSVKTADEFLGKILKLGKTASHAGMGSIEMSPHNNVHDWVGNPKNPNGEDMGTFYSAGRDPLFYAHHANVDRMWNIWQKMEDYPRDHTDPDWLNSSFVLYDEKKNAVCIKDSDCLDSEKLGYVYEAVDIPWLYTEQIPRANPWTKESEPPIVDFPQILDSDITTMVDRPPRDDRERMNEEEVLILEDVEFDPTLRLHFNVLVNVGDEGEDVCPGNIEFVGTFKNIPHGLQHDHAKISLRFVITKAIEKLGLEGDKNLAVKIVPKVNGDRIKIGGIKIQLEDIQ